MTRRRKIQKDSDERREEALRPSGFLGYNRDALGVYFLGRGADALAESQFRRAVWLNPFELSFKVHWAIALLRLGRPDEAKPLLIETLRADPNRADARGLWRRHWPGENPPVKVADADGFASNPGAT